MPFHDKNERTNKEKLTENLSVQTTRSFVLAEVFFKPIRDTCICGIRDVRMKHLPCSNIKGRSLPLLYTTLLQLLFSDEYDYI